MKLLAIETSTDACSVALMLGGQIVAEHRIAAQQHASLILPMVDTLMGRAGMVASQLDALIYGRGPGSFTGVRIGVATAQGIALGADIGVTGISTLQTLAQGCLRQYADTSVAVSVDARMDEVYYCAYQSNPEGLMQPVTEEMVAAPDKLPASRYACWAGSGAERYQEVLAAHYSVAVEQIRAACLPNAIDLLTLGAAKVASGELHAAESASPVYLRDKVALTTSERSEKRTSA